MKRVSHYFCLSRGATGFALPRQDNEMPGVSQLTDLRLPPEWAVDVSFGRSTSPKAYRFSWVSSNAVCLEAERRCRSDMGDTVNARAQEAGSSVGDSEHKKTTEQSISRGSRATRRRGGLKTWPSVAVALADGSLKNLIQRRHGASDSGSGPREGPGRGEVV